MMHATMRRDVVAATASFFMPKLFKCEDFDRFERDVVCDMRSIAAEAVSSCLESFDVALRQHVPRSWSVHERTSRTLLTLVGEVAFCRTIFLDEYGRRRALADELLGIPKRARLSTGAFLWIVERAAEESYRKTADAFTKATGCLISHVTVMNCVHVEGKLLKGAAAPQGTKYSQPTLFLEVDGLWVHTQKHAHRPVALPRFLYEQARKTTSFELKIAALYAGKRQVAPGRKVRDGLALTCSEGDAEAFWEDVFSLIEDNYDLDDVESLMLGADGAAWCGPDRLKEALPASASLSCSLDPFHIMQKIWKAFSAGAQRDWAVNLVLRRKALTLARMCERIAAKTSDGTRRKKITELGSYMANNAQAVVFPKPSMGTMEGTNAHIGAARLKGQGRSWSRAGAEAMCLIRCALATRRALIAPSKEVYFTQSEQHRALRVPAGHVRTSAMKDGRGYLPPHQAFTGAMKRNAGFRARSC